jgi:hypothetical protein
MARVSSVDPSSTIKTSAGWRVCANTESMLFAMYFALLYVGMITDTLGAFTFCPLDLFAVPRDTVNRAGREIEDCALDGLQRL